MCLLDNSRPIKEYCTKHELSSQMTSAMVKDTPFTVVSGKSIGGDFGVNLSGGEILVCLDDVK